MSTTATDEVVKVRLVKGKPVADIDALRKYKRLLPRDQARGGV